MSAMPNSYGEFMELVLADFIKQVSEMRAAQRDYFKQRNQSTLLRAKELEKQVDQVISKYNKAIAKLEEGPRQESLLQASTQDHTPGAAQDPAPGDNQCQGEHQDHAALQDAQT